MWSGVSPKSNGFLRGPYVTSQYWVVSVRDNKQIKSNQINVLTAEVQVNKARMNELKVHCYMLDEWKLSQWGWQL